MERPEIDEPPGELSLLPGPWGREEWPEIDELLGELSLLPGP